MNVIRIKSRSTTRNSEEQDKFTQNPRQNTPVGKVFPEMKENPTSLTKRIFYAERKKGLPPLLLR